MSNNYKCHSCYWKDTHHVNDKSYQICKRKLDMAEAINECSKPGVCPHYITHKEVEKIVDSFTGG